MEEIFHAVPQATANTRKIADMCNVDLKIKEKKANPILPYFEIPKGFNSPDDYLRYLAQQGLAKRYETITQEMQERVDYELDVIISKGFTGYFLIVWDFIRYAHENGVPVGPGRGSGAGSVVAYVLFITNIDPFKYGLLFERFLNPERTSMPDFDIDFCNERRQEVIDYVIQKYGSEKVAQIITFGTLGIKAVLLEVARVLDMPYDEANMLTKLIDQLPPKKYARTFVTPAFDKDGKEMENLDDAIEKEEELKKIIAKGGIYQKLIDISRTLEGLHRHQSIHAAGIVIGKEELTNYVPLCKDPKTGAIYTQFAMDQLEECGLVKIDFLGLTTLTIIKSAENLIRTRAGEEFANFNIENIPENDPLTFKLFQKGNTKDVFLFGYGDIKKLLKQLKPETITDLMALNALYRPGVMKYIPEFIDSKTGNQKATFSSIIGDDRYSCIDDVLKETYGVIVYKEQIMRIIQLLSGYSLGRIDILLREMSKLNMDREKVEKEKTTFIEAAIRNGYLAKSAGKVFDKLCSIATYAFNKSHSAAYTKLAYQAAYLKANFPKEYMVACKKIFAK